MTDNPIAVITDGTTGAIVPAISDAGTNRLAVDARLNDGTGNYASITKDGTIRRLAVDTRGSAVPGANIVNKFLLNGSNSSLIVNGSTTAVPFSYAPASNQSSVITSIDILIVAGTITFAGNRFLNAGIMTTGLALYVTTGGTQTIFTNFQRNEDFAALTTTVAFWQGSAGGLLSGGTNAVLNCSLRTTMLLNGSTSDQVGILVRDNLTSTGGNLVYAAATVQGFIAT